MTKSFYHACSDGNYASALFYDSVDYKAAMNRIAVLVLRLQITILAFVLMDNHFHFVIACDEEEKCLRFINEFKRLTGKHNSEVHQESASIRRLPAKIIKIKDDDALRTVIAYVIKNPTKARIGMFYNYPWGSGGTYFGSGWKKASDYIHDIEYFPGAEPTSRELSLQDNRKIQTVAEMGPFAVRKLCHTRITLPGGWLIADGVILPENYVDIEAVETLYRTPRSYMYSLSLNKDEEIEKEMEEWGGLMMSDIELRAERGVLMRRLFATDSIRSLNMDQRLRLARELKWKFGCSKKQLSRVVHLPYNTIVKAL